MNKTEEFAEWFEKNWYNEEGLLRISDAAAYIERSDETVRNLIKKKWIKLFKYEGKSFVSLSDVKKVRLYYQMHKNMIT